VTHPRADVALVERGLFSSREKAKAAILAGRVTADGEPVTKAGQPLPLGSDIVVERGPEYVSRGGHKLAGALVDLGVDPSGARALDVGASTGGFTDCLLKHGASSVVALDVGYGQLAWELRTDPRVMVFERTNIRYADPEKVGKDFDIVVVDVSFIGLDKVLPRVAKMIGPDADVLTLVKPQFEAGPDDVGRKGVVRDPGTHERTLASAIRVGRELGWAVRGATYSPIAGPKGNIEFWVWFSSYGDESPIDVSEIVRRAHDDLGGG
jgi:23S rRNA (cytidine1920-2'-O)/16S rRNA (cytidine1409-2'-O)-methyltransferase